MQSASNTDKSKISVAAAVSAIVAGIAVLLFLVSSVGLVGLDPPEGFILHIQPRSERQNFIASAWREP
jgi:hypothetical protein